MSRILGQLRSRFGIHQMLAHDPVPLLICGYAAPSRPGNVPRQRQVRMPVSCGRVRFRSFWTWACVMNKSSNGDAGFLGGRARRSRPLVPLSRPKNLATASNSRGAARPEKIDADLTRDEAGRDPQTLLVISREHIYGADENEHPL